MASQRRAFGDLAEMPVITGQPTAGLLRRLSGNAGIADTGRRESSSTDAPRRIRAAVDRADDALHTWTLMDDPRQKPEGLLGRWEERNQRIVERQTGWY